LPPLKVTPGSAINFITETKRCRQGDFQDCFTSDLQLGVNPIVACIFSIDIYCPICGLQQNKLVKLKFQAPELKFQAPAPGIQFLWLRIQHVEVFGSGSTVIFVKLACFTIYT